MSTLGPWATLPHSDRPLARSYILGFKKCLSPQKKEQVLTHLSQLLETIQENEKSDQFEVLILIHSNHPSKIIQDLPSPLLRFVRVVPLESHLGWGSTIQKGFLESRGKILFSVPLEILGLPRAIGTYSEFFIEARQRLQRGEVDLVQSKSGIFAISWGFAYTVLTLQTEDYLFDFELALISRRHGKSKGQVFKELKFFSPACYSLLWHDFQGGYLPESQSLSVADFDGITADDWGLSPGVNQGILKLAQQKIIRRVSLMADCAYLEQGIIELSQIPNLQFGLHFNLTYNKKPASPAKLLLRWLNPFLNRSLERKRVQDEFRNQIRKLNSLGIQIQYVDGHHHIHIIPGIFACIANLVRENRIQEVRLPYDPKLWFSSKFAINLFSLFIRKQLRKLKFSFRPFFYPHSYDFNHPQKLKMKLKKQLKLSLHSEIIVHPAEFDDLKLIDPPDSYTAERVTEFQALRMTFHHRDPDR